MKAMILAAGEGTRIREITKGEIPKPMVKIDGKPLIEYTVDELAEFGVEEIIINLHHQGEAIRDHFGDSWNGVPIRYSEENQLLGTSGGVKKVEDTFEDSFIVVYGDVLTDLDFSDIAQYHRRKDGTATLMVYEEDREDLPEASIILTDEDEKVQKFMEKPSEETIQKYSGRDFWTNAGVYVLEPDVFDYIPEGFSDFSNDVFPDLLKSGESIHVFPKPEDSYWHEVGNPKRYRKAIKDLKNKVPDFSN